MRGRRGWPVVIAFESGGEGRGKGEDRVRASGPSPTSRAGCSGADFRYSDVMGYELHITRAESWVEAESNPITLEEWLAYIKSDPELEIDEVGEATTTDGETVFCGDPGLAIWTAHPEDGADGGRAWIYHSQDCIVVKNPDQQFTAKMWRIAQHFGARVYGDEDEEYGADGEQVGEGEGSRDRGVKRPWWKRLLGG